MQFPVPQFTEVEDKIIASLSVRQFGLLFAAGVVVFLFFSATKNIIGTIIVFLLVGVPALVIAFIKVNGRPLYRTAGHLVSFFIHPREMLFHKDGNEEATLETLQTVSTNAMDPAVRQPTLAEVELMLEKQRDQEQQLLQQTQNKS